MLAAPLSRFQKLCNVCTDEGLALETSAFLNIYGDDNFFTTISSREQYVMLVEASVELREDIVKQRRKP